MQKGGGSPARRPFRPFSRTGAVFSVGFQLFHGPVVVAGCDADKVGTQGAPAHPGKDSFGEKLPVGKAIRQRHDLGMGALQQTASSGGVD